MKSHFAMSLVGCIALMLLAATTQAAEPGPTSAPTSQPTADVSKDQPVNPAGNKGTGIGGSGPGDLTSLSIDELMNVEVTSVNKFKERIADAPAAITEITQDDIRQSGLHQIPEILRLSPGLFVQHGGQLTGWSVSSRGFSEMFDNKLLVLEDGRTLYTPYFSGVYWDTVDYPIADLDRIEVIRGPGATLWGANAVNGVINITSKSAKDTQGAMVDTRVGTDESDLTVRYGGQIDERTYFRVYGKGTAFDDLEHAATPQGNDNQWQDSRGGFRIDRYATDKDTFTVQGDSFYQSISDKGALEIPVPPYGHDYHSGANVLGRWTHLVSDTSDYSLQAYYDRVNLRDSAVDYHLDTFDVDFQHRFELANSNELMYGLGGRLMLDSVGRSLLAAPMVEPDSRNTYLISAFAQDTITLVPDKFKVIIGSKFEVNSFTGFEIQPGGRVVWTPNDANTVWGSISRSVRTPSRWQHDSAFIWPISLGGGQTGILDIRGSHEQSEKLIAYELGYRHQFTSTLSTDMSGFIDNYDHLIAEISAPPVFVPTPAPHLLLPTEWVNAGTAESYGAELAINWQVTPKWRLTGSDSFLTVFRHRNPNTTLTWPEKAVEDSTPENQFQIHSHLDITKQLEFNASVYYEGSVLGILGDRIKAYTRADFNVVWKPKPNLAVTIGVQNAFLPHHQETSGQEGTAEVPRSAYAQATWTF